MASDLHKTEKLQNTGHEGYHTYPVTTTHGPKDKSCYHGRPEDWKRVGVKRSFGKEKLPA